MDIKITFPHRVLRSLCHKSDRPVSLETAKDLVLEAIDPAQQKLSGLKSPFARASLHLEPFSHVLAVSFDKAVLNALGQTPKSFPDFMSKRLYAYATQAPESRKLLEDTAISVSLR